jgi:hypothetical protein
LNKSDINQHVKFGSAVLSFLMVAVGAVYLIPDLGGPDKRLSEISHQKAEGLAYQILQIHSDSKMKPNSGGRGPASESPVAGGLSTWKLDGELGADPWGNPYHYHLEYDGSKILRTIEVWSQKDSARVRIPVPEST